MHSWWPFRAVLLASLIFACGSSIADEASVRAPGSALVLSLSGAVSPATADYLQRGIRRGAEQQAELIVIKLDTPGGLDTAMRDIIKAMLSSPVPVATLVAPGGARAASAGTYILYASHIAAMAPGTNLGAATPVAIGAPGRLPSPQRPTPEPSGGNGADDGQGEKGAKAQPDDPMKAKQVNDAAAYIRGLAQLRGRNSEWAELAVREAASLSAEDAFSSGVVDLIALDVPDLLQKIDGKKLEFNGQERTLSTSPIDILVLEPDWRSRLLAVIANPGVALILMMIGIYGLIFEFANPGFVVPGVVGAICLLLAAFALQLMPVSYAGLALILLGLGFVIAEVFMPSFGILGIGGAIAMIFGAVMLFDEEASAAYALPVPFVVALGAISSALVFATVAMAFKARKRPVVSGQEDLFAASGIVLEEFEGDGWVRVAGERWRARCGSRLHRGQSVVVKSLEGLTLTVEPAEAADEPAGGRQK